MTATKSMIMVDMRCPLCNRHVTTANPNRAGVESRARKPEVTRCGGCDTAIRLVRAEPEPGFDTPMFYFTCKK
jgi:uncharacterized protein with PIN domain